MKVYIVNGIEITRTSNEVISEAAWHGQHGHPEFKWPFVVVIIHRMQKQRDLHGTVHIHHTGPLQTT